MIVNNVSGGNGKTLGPVLRHSVSNCRMTVTDLSETSVSLASAARNKPVGCVQKRRSVHV